MPAADVEPVLGAGHGDVEQAAILLVPAALGFGAGLGADLLLEAAPRRPDRQVLATQERRACRRLRRRIGQGDDRRLQPFRALPGHTPPPAPPTTHTRLTWPGGL